MNNIHLEDVNIEGFKSFSENSNMSFWSVNALREKLSSLSLTDSPGHRDDLARGVSVRHVAAYAHGVPEALATQCACALLSLETAEPIGPIELI